MAYTPINWQTGDTITAEKLNRCDNGWSVGMAQLFSETVTTADQGGLNAAPLAYSSVIDAASIAVTLDGTDYECPRLDFGSSYFYGGFSTTTPGPDFTDYPFFIASSDSEGNTLFTQTAGTHTVAASGDTVECGDSFTAAVSTVIERTSAMPFELVEDTTLYSEASAAFNSGRLLYFNYGLDRYFVSKLGRGSEGVQFVPESSEFTAGFDYDYSTFYFTQL